MKRYWILALLIPFTALSISIYYATASEDHKPDYYLKTLAGQEQEGSHIAIQGQYETDPITIQTTGSDYSDEHQSYWQKLDSSYYYLEELGGLLPEHRSFMRGKRNVNAFFEDEKVIGYVGSESDFDLEKGQPDILDIALYDKGKKKKSADFQVKLKKDKNEFISIADVQVKEQTMKLLVAYQHRTETNPRLYKDAEYHLYTLDLDKRSVVDHQLIEPAASPDNRLRTSTTNVWSSDQIKANRYAIFDRITYKDDAEEDTVELRSKEIVNREILVYDIWNGQLTRIQNEPMRNLLLNAKTDELTIRQVGGELYITKLSDSGESQVLRYDLNGNVVKSDVKLALQDVQKEWRRTGMLQIVNNRIYMYMSGKGNPGVAVAELETGKMVYQGVIERKDNLEIRNLMIDHLSIK
ncbi:hypothetical protein QFZ77_006953 [Paenibacillus sp. V4I3]|uniref:hypothetical protein n=1 Tax=Paenibacillus sp. V4I3 TaxID=3042305 RepID=UPI002787C81A|nr:hypothetical protein [Paenibacillus sp. V4I3]MDQ0878294.1 hypothetical protein [Paenibacillus sp. V4I3]